MMLLLKWCSCRETRASGTPAEKLSAALIEDGTRDRQCQCHRWRQGDLSSVEWPTNSPLREPDQCMWSPTTLVSSTLNRSHHFLRKIRGTGPPVAGKRFCFRTGAGALPGEAQHWPRMVRAAMPRRLTPSSLVLPAAPRGRRRRLPNRSNLRPNFGRPSAESHSLFTPMLTTRRFSVAGWWRRPLPAFCVRVSWMSTSARRATQTTHGPATPAAKTPDQQGSQDSRRSSPEASVELQQPGRKGIGRRSHIHRGGWQVCAHRNDCNASASHRPGARNR